MFTDFSLTVSDESVGIVPGYSATGTCGIPSACEITRAWYMNPVDAIATEGIPHRSATAHARNTAGVQLPHAPTAAITESTPVRRSTIGSASITSASS